MKRTTRRAIAAQTCALSLSIACSREGDLSEATSDAGIEEADTNLNEDGASSSGETSTPNPPVRPRPRPEPSVVPSDEPSTEPDIDVSSDDAPAQPSVEPEP